MFLRLLFSCLFAFALGGCHRSPSVPVVPSVPDEEVGSTNKPLSAVPRLPVLDFDEVSSSREPVYKHVVVETYVLPGTPEDDFSSISVQTVMMEKPQAELAGGGSVAKLAVLQPAGVVIHSVSGVGKNGKRYHKKQSHPLGEDCRFCLDQD